MQAANNQISLIQLLELLQKCIQVKKVNCSLQIKTKDELEHSYSKEQLDSAYDGLWKILIHAFKISNNSKHHDFGTPVRDLMLSAVEHLLTPGKPLPKWRYYMRKPLGIEYNVQSRRYELWGLIYCISRVDGKYEVGGVSRFMYVEVCKDWMNKEFPGVAENVLRLAAMNITEPDEVGAVIFDNIWQGGQVIESSTLPDNIAA